MGKLVKFVASSAFDDYNQNYADNTTFWTLEDFIVRVGHAASTYYLTGWKKMYDEARAEGIPEVISFDATTLSEQFVKVERDSKTSEWVGEICHPSMSLPFDQQTSGFQNVFNAETGAELERSNIGATWRYKFLPKTSRQFFRIEKNKLRIWSNGDCNIKEARILYVPSISIGDGDAELPDGIVSYCIAATIAYMREASQRVIKESLDGNKNLLPQLEANT